MSVDLPLRTVGSYFTDGLRTMNKFLFLALTVFALFPDWPDYASAHAKAIADVVLDTQQVFSHIAER